MVLVNNIATILPNMGRMGSRKTQRNCFHLHLHFPQVMQEMAKVEPPEIKLHQHPVHDK
jgi:hypothetical protein